MRNSIRLWATVFGLGLLASGCAGPEKKLGRGLNNLTEFTRWGEISRSVEQTAVWEGNDVAYTTGFIRGFNRSVARTFIGLYEVVTFPFPSYDPVATRYLSVTPVYPDAYRPSFIADSFVSPDAAIGFAGGDIAPMVPGSRFRIFDY